MASEIELQVVPVPVAPAISNKQICVDEATGQSFVYDEVTGQTAWLCKFIINDNNKPGDKITVSDNSWEPGSTTFTVPYSASVGDILQVNEQGAVLQVKSAAANNFTVQPEQQQNVTPATSVVVVVPSMDVGAQFQNNPMQPQQQQQQLQRRGSLRQQYIDAIMADDDDVYGGNNILYKAQWNRKAACCCCSNDVIEGSGIKPEVELFVKDRHIKIVQRKYCCTSLPMPMLQCPSEQTTHLNVNAIHAVSISEKNITCCTYFLTYLCWFFCGCFGCHYCMHKKRFRQSWCHRFYLLVYFLTGGFFLVGWLIDGFRLNGWLQAYTMQFYGKRNSDSILLDVRSMDIMQKIRDTAYRVMAPGRQMNKKSPTVSHLSCEDQEAKAAAENIVKSEPQGCFCCKQEKTKIVVTKDRLILHKQNQNGFKNIWVDMFLLDLQGIELTTPTTYPLYYVWFYAFPPWGLMGCHRIKFGHKGIELYLYQLTCGYFGIGWLYDMLTMCFCINNIQIKSELKMVVEDCEEWGDFQMLLQDPKDNERLRRVLATELRKNIAMSTSNDVGTFKHIRHTALMDCCKDWFDNTTRDTKIDSLSISVRQTFKTKRKPMCIPPSPCCPFCWMFRPFVCLCPCMTFCFVQTTDVVDQELYHLNAGRKSNLYDMPNSSMKELFLVWLFTGLFGGHRFKTRHNTMGRVFVCLWILVLLWGIAQPIINSISINRSGASGASGASYPVYCEPGQGFEEYGYHCASCAPGKYQDQSYADRVTCKSCPSGYVALNTRADHCQIDVSGGNQQPVYPQIREAGKVCADLPNAVELTNSAICANKLSMWGVIFSKASSTGKCVGTTKEGQIIRYCSMTCPKGAYQNKLNQDSCLQCPNGQYQDLEGKSFCKSCGPGEETSRDQSFCLKPGENGK
jgi:hypothetical protein